MCKLSCTLTILCDYCPCFYCDSCFVDHVKKSYPYQCYSCHSIWTSRWVETKKPFIRNELIETKTNHLLKKELEWLPLTQKYAIYTKQVNQIKEDTLQLNQQIKDLQYIVKQLKVNKETLDKKLVQEDVRIYERKCSNCKGYIDQNLICGLCNRETQVDSETFHQASQSAIRFQWEWTGPELPELYDTIQRIRHLVYHIYPSLNGAETNANQDLRIRYLLEEITLDQFRLHLSKRYNRMECNTDYHSIVVQYIHKIQALTQDVTFLEKETECRLQANESIQDLNMFYHSDQLLI